MWNEDSQILLSFCPRASLKWGCVSSLFFSEQISANEEWSYQLCVTCLCKVRLRRGCELPGPWLSESRSGCRGNERCFQKEPISRVFIFFTHRERFHDH